LKGKREEVVGVEMSNLMIVYDDGTAWEDGTVFRRDRPSPRKRSSPRTKAFRANAPLHINGVARA
jgi:hypothetical protein